MFEAYTQPAVTMSSRQLKACLPDGESPPVIRTDEECRLIRNAKRRVHYALAKKIRQHEQGLMRIGRG